MNPQVILLPSQQVILLVTPSVKLSIDLSPIKMTAIGYFSSTRVLGLGYEEAFCFFSPCLHILSEQCLKTGSRRVGLNSVELR